MCIRDSYKTLLQSLKDRDPIRFSGDLEALMIHEFRLAITKLVRLGIGEAERLLIPDL